MPRLLLRLVLLLLALAASATATEPADAHLHQSTSRIRLQTARASVDVHRDPYALTFRSRSGALTAEALPVGTFWERGGQVHHPTRVTAAVPATDGVTLTVDTDEGAPATVSLRWLTSRTLEVVVQPPAPETLEAVGERLTSPPSEAIYGLTERLRDSPPIADGLLDVPIEDTKPVEVGSLDRRGETVAMYVRPTFALYAPFFHSSRGYGLSVDGTMVGAFDVAKTEPGILSFRFETGTVPENRRLAFHVFVGPEHATILDEYTALVGRPVVPPDWTFLHWRWRDTLDVGPPALLDGVPVNAEVAEDVTMYEQLGIPPGVYHFDRPVLVGEYGFAQLAWDETRLPNPTQMLASLRQRGYRIGTWSGLWTCGSGPDDDGTEAQALGYLVPGPVGTPHCDDVTGISFILDPTNPDMRAWWRDKIRDFVQANGIDVIKLDRGEEHIPSKATDVWADGRTGREVRNAYPILQAQIHYDALAAAHPDGDFVLFTRAGYTGTSHLAVVWGGDIPGSESFGSGPGTDLGLRSAIISQQRAAFLGYPIWGSDTGGYYEFKDREVFARWIEFSAFSGIMEVGGHGTHAPWDMPTTPSYDQQMIDIYRRYTQLRVTLQPYVVTAAQDAAQGLPLVRPMPFVDRRDPRLRDRWDEYMFGPDLLVAPVWKVGQTSRPVYFPRGSWHSYWDPTQTYRGRRTVTVQAPLDTIPVFVRDGAQVPGP